MLCKSWNPVEDTIKLYRYAVASVAEFRE